MDILDGNVTRDNYGVLVIQSPSTPPEHEQDEIHGFSNPNYNAAYAREFNVTCLAVTRLMTSINTA